MKRPKSFTRFLLAAIVLLAIVLLSATLDAHGYDLFGNDIAAVAVSNPDACAAACNGNSNCLAWTYVRARGLCYFKNPVPQPSWNSVCPSNFECLSGYKMENWCGDKLQGDVLKCTAGKVCYPRRSRSCEGWWIFRTCTTLQTTDYFCQ